MAQENLYNPFEHIHKRFDIIEAQLTDVRNKLNIRDGRELLTRQMIRDQYHISLGTIDNHRKLGLLKSEKVGSRVLIYRQDVDNWVKQNFK